MAIERTLSIIKPNAVAKNAIGAILDRFESQGLSIVAARMLHMSREQANRGMVDKRRKRLAEREAHSVRVKALNLNGAPQFSYFQPAREIW